MNCLEVTVPGFRFGPYPVEAVFTTV